MNGLKNMSSIELASKGVTVATALTFMGVAFGNQRNIGIIDADAVGTLGNMHITLGVFGVVLLLAPFILDKKVGDKNIAIVTALIAFTTAVISIFALSSEELKDLDEDVEDVVDAKAAIRKSFIVILVFAGLILIPSFGVAVKPDIVNDFASKSKSLRERLNEQFVNMNRNTDQTRNLKRFNF